MTRQHKLFCEHTSPILRLCELWHRHQHPKPSVLTTGLVHWFRAMKPSDTRNSLRAKGNKLGIVPESPKRHKSNIGCFRGHFILLCLSLVTFAQAVQSTCLLVALPVRRTPPFHVPNKANKVLTYNRTWKEVSTSP